MAKKVTKKNKEDETSSFMEKENIHNTLSYFPYIGALIMYIWKRPSKWELLRNIKYSGILAIGAILLCIILNSFFWAILHLVYLGISIFFAWKAYNEEKIRVGVLDKVLETIESMISRKTKK